MRLTRRRSRDSRYSCVPSIGELNRLFSGFEMIKDTLDLDEISAPT